MRLNQQRDLGAAKTVSYQKLLDRIPYLAWLMTDGGEILAVNQQWCDYIDRIVGVGNSVSTGDEERSWLFGEILHEDERESFVRAWEQSRSLQTALNLKLQFQSRQENWEWFEVELDPDLNELGQTIWICTAIRLGGEVAIPHRQQSAQFLEALLANASDGIVACDADGHLVLFNLAAQMFHGLPPEPIEPEDWANYYDLYDRDGIKTLTKSEIPLFRALKGESVVSQEMMIRSKQGGDRSLLASGTAIYSQTGEKLGAVVLMRDITDYRQTTIALQDSEQKFRAIFDGAFQFIGLVKPDGTVIEANLTALKFGGIKAEDAIDRLFWEVPGWNFAPAVREQLRAWTALAAGGDFIRHEVEIVGADDRSITLDFSLTPIRNDRGEVILIIPEGRDITQLKQAEVERIRAQIYNERLSIAMRVAKAGAWNWDLVTKQTFWTPEFEVLFDYEPGSTEQVYSEWLDRVHPDDIDRVETTLQQAVEGTIPEYRCDYRIVLRNGDIRWIDVAGELHPDEQGKPKSMSGLVYDITDRKQWELTIQTQATDLQQLNNSLILAQQQLQERNQELDRFVAIVAHDLKAPLRAIANLSAWIEEDLQEQIPEENLQLKLLRQRVNRMDALIDGLLRYSRAGRENLVTETVDVAEVLAETIDSLSPPSCFQIQIDDNMPILNTKKLLLTQVFANLISNAIKHHNRVDGKVEITVEDLGDRDRFSIADDGPGIPLGESQNRIFEIFQTLNPTTDSTENTGIGLALVKKIVEGEGGEIWLDGESKLGCRFCFTWLKTAILSG
jgi:PAS domain S-box-containing protein